MRGAGWQVEARRGQDPAALGAVPPAGEKRCTCQAIRGQWIETLDYNLEARVVWEHAQPGGIHRVPSASAPCWELGALPSEGQAGWVGGWRGAGGSIPVR